MKYLCFMTVAMLERVSWFACSRCCAGVTDCGRYGAIVDTFNELGFGELCSGELIVAFACLDGGVLVLSPCCTICFTM